jgi:predicted nucleotidyltransferase
MSTPNSDFDFKAVVIPTLEDLVRNTKPVSTTIDINSGKIDLKDIRIFTENITKMNPVYLETLFTDNKIVLDKQFEKIINEKDYLVKEMTALIYR